MDVHLTHTAKASLLNIQRFIARGNPSRSVSFIAEILDACHALAEQPRAWPIIHRYVDGGVRKRPWRGYLILYRLHGSRIEVLHIVHAARSLDALLLPSPDGDGDGAGGPR